MKFINFRAFRHAIDVIRGKYDDPNEPGEVSHFQALATALAGTVGLGNIAGVAILFCVLSILGGKAGSTMFQTNQSYLAVSQVFPWFADKAWLYGMVMAILVGIVILGGMKRIGTVAGAIVPQVKELRRSPTQPHKQMNLLEKD